MWNPFLPFLLNQGIHTVKGDSAVITDDASASIGIRQACDDMAGTACPHLRGVGVEYTCIMGFSVLGKEFHNFRINLISIVLAGLHSHADTTVRLEGTLKWFVGLKAYDSFLVLI